MTNPEPTFSDLENTFGKLVGEYEHLAPTSHKLCLVASSMNIGIYLMITQADELFVTYLDPHVGWKNFRTHDWDNAGKLVQNALEVINND